MISKANPERKAGLIDEKSDGKKRGGNKYLKIWLVGFVSISDIKGLSCTLIGLLTYRDIPYTCMLMKNKLSSWKNNLAG